MKVLLIEDTPRYVVAARRFFTSTEHEVQYVTKFSKALDVLEKVLSEPKIDGVITDMFIPVKKSQALKVVEYLERHMPHKDTEGAFNKSMAAIRRRAGKRISRSAPVGVEVVARCIHAGVPVVVATDLHHHALTFEAVRQYLAVTFYRGRDWDLAEGYKGRHVCGREYRGLVASFRKIPEHHKDKLCFWENALQKLEALSSTKR